jgi:hypothetical protein
MTENNETQHPIAEQLQGLITVYGKEKVLHFASQLMEAKKQPLNNAYALLLSVKAITQTLDALDIAAAEIATKSGLKEAAYGGKGDLLKQKFELEKEVKLSEADAFMLVDESGKFDMVGDKKIPLSNDIMRDAYRRQASKEPRSQLAKIDGEITCIDTQLQQANDALYAAKDALESAKAKAGLQAALLNFIAGQ